VSLDRCRSAALQRIEAQLTEASWEEEGIRAVLLVGVNRLRQLNLSHGYRRVDRLLEALAQRVEGFVSGKGIAERIGNADYLIVLQGIRNPGHARLALARLHALLSAVYAIDGETHHLSLAIGAALFDPAQAPADLESCLRRLERALLNARQTPEGYAFDGDRQTVEEGIIDWDLEHDLRQAADRGQLAMYYQPQQRLDDGRLHGVEALIRWRNGAQGFVRPDLFIPIAERSTLIEEITTWTLNAVMREMASRNGIGHVSINLSAQLLQRQDIVDDVRAALAIWGFDPARLVLEVTESAVISRLDQAVDTLQALRELGIGLSIDDFGTGYSTMTYLRRIPACELKIDRSFIANMTGQTMDAHIVKSLILMARGLQMRVVAEGVEDEETRALLRDMGCELIQGYLLARPMPLAELDGWLEDASGRQ